MEAETQRLLHELKVHQIELGAQNAELLRLKEEAEHDAKKYRELYNSSPTGYLTLSSTGNILELNLAGAEMLGIYHSNLKNLKFFPFVSPATRPIFNLFIKNVFDHLIKETCVVILSLNGDKHIDVSLSGIVKADGGNCFVTMVDISERNRTLELLIANKELLYQNDEKAKRAAELMIANKEQLFQSNEKAKLAKELFISNELIAFQRDRLQNIASLVPGIVYQYRLRPDGSSCFPYASDAIQSVYRVTPEEVREDGAKVFANLHPDDYDGVVAAIQQSAKDLSIWQQDFRVKFDDGTIRYLYGNSVPQLEADGSVLWHGFINDITERKEMELALKQSEHRYRSLIELTPGAVIIHRDLKIIYANPAAIVLFGANSLQELAGTTIWDRIHPDCHLMVMKIMQQTWDENVLVPLMDCRYCKLDGTEFDAEVQATRIRYDGLPSIHATIYNTTERKEKEQKIILQNEELRKLNAEKDIFFSIIAHDLRGPMGLFMQLTELLADKELGLSADEVSEMIDDMSKSARNTFNLLENLLEWAQISRGYSDFNPIRINLNRVITECINILAEQARGKEIELVNEIEIEPEVIADINMLQSVIRNLFSNAIKFTREGGKVTISTQTTENNQILVSVKDTGIGMTEDLRNKLFHIDANTKRPGTKGEQSTGLGLLLCKEFVEKQGGKISVESEQKIGSVFSFTLPLSGSSPKNEVPEIVMPPDSQKRTLKNLNILIAEDDVITAKLISYFIKGISNQVFRANTGGVAVEICRNHPEIDLVIMDIKMPAMDGYEATRQIRQFNPGIVILAESTFTMPSDRELAIEAGCNDYLLKPFTREVFEGMIQKYV